MSAIAIVSVLALFFLVSCTANSQSKTAYAQNDVGAVPEISALPDSANLREPDGGSQYYSEFSSGLPEESGYFPLGVWLESVVDPIDVEKDVDVGLNTYIDLTENSDPSLLAGSNIRYMTSWDAPGRYGAVLADEVDMWGGPGSAKWTGRWPGQGEICSPAKAKCGYTVQNELMGAVPSGMLRYANYGKGATFWETDAEATRFVSEFQDIVSADNYWFTDPHICVESQGGLILDSPRQLKESECRRPSNYGWTVDRVRNLVEPAESIPVWSFVEVGHPFTEPGAPTITGPQIRAAVWSSIIHGARGIVYFNHNLSGECPTQHALRDCGVELRDHVRSLNRQVTELAPVLNSVFLDGILETSGEIDASVKVYDGDIYVLAGVSGGQRTRATFDLECVADGRAEVVFEGRDIAVEDGILMDNFSDSNSVHIYKIPGNLCGL
ncbi:hypothetical protein FQ154_07475 [Paeniglutamicibacter gangotriensis]|uniref:Glycoside hydrolase family 42 N-terminal domain-containing protein n=1 Tax=Paeniglutamicibacter gangotriensis TaxID=254787 RepID=A0A5B0EEQ6_9MICC|nr:hypothetical protein [Paeniglutamicibacter gangotriensis]KAA0977554.1 hypothetical protein FQ154_07475 [Paeniglutamicibacter gangotriensis]